MSFDSVCWLILILCWFEVVGDVMLIWRLGASPSRASQVFYDQSLVWTNLWSYNHKHKTNTIKRTNNINYSFWQLRPSTWGVYIMYVHKHSYVRNWTLVWTLKRCWFTLQVYRLFLYSIQYTGYSIHCILIWCSSCMYIVEHISLQYMYFKHHYKGDIIQVMKGLDMVCTVI